VADLADKSTDGPDGQVNDGRRTFCKLCIGGLSAISAATVAYPIFSFLGQPVTVGADKPLEVSLEGLVPGQAQYVEFRGEQLIVLGGADLPRVFNASCPHLGCNVAWSAADAVFRCPCHGAMFNGEGQVISGPVSANLRAVPFTLKDGKIVIS
jgi:Rieske Fe-S protein